MQAATFIKVVRANGGLRPTDMPPVLDLEWDKATKDGVDRWGNRKPREIIEMVKSFCTKVESELKRKPMIYTARQWWRERIGSEDRFSEFETYPLWIADYSKTSRASEIPATINNKPATLWQFTASATMSIGFNESFDANIFKGEPREFYNSLGVVEF
jgi:lysozyme